MEEIVFSRVFSSLVDKSQYTDSEIARRLGVNRSTIGRWKSGEQSPPLIKIPAIAALFGVSPTIFVGGQINDEPETIAAHHDGDEWTEEELEALKEFKEILKLKRILNNQNKE